MEQVSLSLISKSNIMWKELIKSIAYNYLTISYPEDGTMPRSNLFYIGKPPRSFYRH